MTTLIVAPKADLTLLPTPPEALALLAGALDPAAGIPHVFDTEQEQALAVAAQKSVKALINDIEAAREAVKRPALDFGRVVDSRAKVLSVELKAEELRIARAVGTYQHREADKIREAQRKIEQERAEIEARLKAQEEEARAQAEAEGKSAKDQEVEAIIRQQRVEQELAALPVISPPPRQEGQTVRQEWKFRVTDIWALVRAHPGLVKVEPRNREILELLKLGHKLAGIEAWQETISSVRVSGKPQQYIEA